MSGTKGHSGGANRLSIQQHLERGTLRPHRHLQPTPPPPAPLLAADLSRTLEGLPAVALRVAKGLLDGFDGWSVASLETLRSYALSCERLEKLQTDPDDLRVLHAETRCNLSLLKALDLERAE